MVPSGIRSDSRLALGVTRRLGRDRLGGLDSWVMLTSPGKEVCLGYVFLPNSEVVTCMWYSNIGLWPKRRQPSIINRCVRIWICAWISLAALKRQSSFTILPTLLPVKDLSAKKPVYLNKQKGLEDDYITVPHLFLLNNCSNQKFIFGDLPDDPGSFRFIRSKDLKAI